MRRPSRNRSAIEPLPAERLQAACWTRSRSSGTSPAMRRSAAIGVVVVGLAARFVAAQAPVPPAGTEYSPADIAFGAKVYAAQCSTCHLPTGDGVGGVDLRSGKFRSATTVQDVANIVGNGLPGTGMNGVRNCSSAERDGVVAYLRNMNTFDVAGVTSGMPERGRAIVDSRNCLRCHRINGEGSRV